MTDHINRAAQTLSLAPWADLSITEQVRWLNAAGRLSEAGLLVTPEHDQQVILNYLRTQHTPTVRIENPEQIVPFLAKAWDEGCAAGLREANDKARGVQNNPAPNPYRREAGESGADA